MEYFFRNQKFDDGELLLKRDKLPLGEGGAGGNLRWISMPVCAIQGEKQ